MRNAFSIARNVAGFALFGILPLVASADTLTLRRDMILPVEFESSLTLKENRPGDTFFVKVRDTDLVPKGTELEGTIERIHVARGNRSSSMDLRFHHIILPDHTRVLLDASPLPLDNRYLTRDGDGRMVAKQDVRKQQSDVIGGAVGGFIVGSIFHRRITGTILGTIVGSIAAQNDRDRDTNLVVKQGERIGALINESVTIQSGPSAPPSRLEVNSRLDRRMSDPVRQRGTIELENRYNIRLSFHDKLMEFPDDALPYRVGKNLMVPLDPAARQFGLDVDRRPNGTVYVDGADLNIRLLIGSKDARLDGKNIELPRPLLDKNGVLFVPIDALLPLIKDEVLLNGKRLEQSD